MNEFEQAQVRNYYRPIYELLDDFASGKIEPEMFETQFFELYSGLTGELTHEAFLTTEWLFGSVEEWNADERLRDEGAPTTDELRMRIGEFLARIGFGGPQAQSAARVR